jgi:putative DNA primase/helicase
LTSKVTPISAVAWRKRLLVSKEGQALSVVANATTILGNDAPWAGVLAWDAFAHEVITAQPPPWHEDDAPAQVELGPWSEQDDVRAAAWLARRYGVKLTPSAVRSAVDVVARRDERHPVRAYLHGLTWDGTPRVSSWLSTHLGVGASGYASTVGRVLLLSAVARVMRPGCKVDTMTVLEGDQGAGKSRAVRVLFGDWASDSPPDLASKDRFVGLRGRWGIEWSELDGFDRSEVNRLKGFLSSPVDDYRPPYGRANVRVPRQCVFVGTVNGSDYLRDVTGNRRYLPVTVGRIDLEALARDRDQLWAEATVLYHEGVPWWPEGEEVDDCRAEQGQRVAVDAWEERIERYALNSDFVTVGDILSEVFELEPAKHGHAEQIRVARALQKLGWVRKQRREGTRRTWGYVPSVPSAAEVVT